MKGTSLINDRKPVTNPFEMGDIEWEVTLFSTRKEDKTHT